MNVETFGFDQQLGRSRANHFACLTTQQITLLLLQIVSKSCSDAYNTVIFSVPTYLNDRKRTTDGGFEEEKVVGALLTPFC